MYNLSDFGIFGLEFCEPLVQCLLFLFIEFDLAVLVQEFFIEFHLGEIDRAIVPSEKAVASVGFVEVGFRHIENGVFAGYVYLRGIFSIVFV